MPAEVESLMYVNANGDERNVPWHGLGTSIDHAASAQEALELGGLNWKVTAEPIFVNGHEVPGYQANVRETDKKVLGIVTNRYEIVQNKQAFDFIDGLLGEGVTFETAGSLEGGKRVFMCAHLPKEKILGDDIVPYLVFTNGFNGKYTVRACCTPVRVVCRNTLNYALNTANRYWSTRHTGRIEDKLEEARNTLNLAKHYMKELDVTADILANTKVTDDEVMTMLNNMYPVKDDDSDRKKNNVADIKNGFMMCMLSPDILKFKNTAWGVVNAASDFYTHTPPKRITNSWNEKNFGKVLDGNVMIDTVFLNMLKKAKQNV